MTHEEEHQVGEKGGVIYCPSCEASIETGGEQYGRCPSCNTEWYDKPVPEKKPEIVLTEEQQSAADKIIAWGEREKSGGQMFKLGGYAGTGKTTVIKFLLKMFAEKGLTCRVAAFTGKAVNVLNRKGVFAQTIHSLIYNVDVDPKSGAVSFYKRAKLDGEPHVIIIDEASMISSQLLNDLLSYGVKLLFVGDPGQLEPVGDNPDLMAMPDIVLEKIHRQAEESPIIHLASSIRTTGVFDIRPGQDRVVLRPKSLNASEAVQADQLICAKNQTRWAMNDRLRAFKGHISPLVKGEKIIVLKNNQDFGVFNGMILFVEEIREEVGRFYIVDAKDEGGGYHSKLPIWKEFIEDLTLKAKKDHIIPRFNGKQGVMADYGYVITCHKSQGSEWGHVMVWDEDMSFAWDMKRWRYTAITRAAERLTYFK